uniref:Uncharacterized protein LOC111134051 n=1 Tax=Crassostrea virginica TaxID=6565 RepID=A0A8B8EGE2_CRAVI|nr:uncharacterized protein LOC111134051 [Crassostrea virginica]
MKNDPRWRIADRGPRSRTAVRAEQSWCTENMQCAAIALLTLSLLGGVQGSCKIYKKEAEGYSVQRNDAGVVSCSYIDQSGTKIQVLVNATNRHPLECEDCKCQTSGELHCCVYGTRAGLVSHPSTCTLVKVSNCESKLVLKSDEKTPCIEGPIYPSSTEANTDDKSAGAKGASQQEAGSKNDNSAANAIRPCAAIFIFIVFLIV